MWTVPTYRDYLDAGETPVLEERGAEAKCPECAAFVLPITIVDCRAVDNTYVSEDWACHRCWPVWIRNSKKPENLLAELEDQAGPGKASKRGFLKDRGLGTKHSDEVLERLVEEKLVGNRASMMLREVLNEMIDRGFEIKTKRPHCFTVSQWMEMHGAPAHVFNKFKGKKADFFP
jgi:hypothetical protein